MERIPIQHQEVSRSESEISEYLYVAVGDINNPTETPQLFDAFVCYNQDERKDLVFVKELIEKLEGPHKMKLFVPGRDDLPGAAQNVIDAYLIEKRCRRVVLIISKAFLRSPACDFQARFALSLSSGAKSKKLIPLILEEGCKEQIPFLKHIMPCDFTREDMREWAWERLVAALKSRIAYLSPNDDGSSDTVSTGYMTINEAATNHVTDSCPLGEDSRFVWETNFGNLPSSGQPDSLHENTGSRPECNIRVQSSLRTVRHGNMLCSEAPTTTEESNVHLDNFVVSSTTEDEDRERFV